MFNSTEVVIDAFSQRLAEAYVRNWGSHEQRYGEILVWAGRMALERIAETDALYHTVDHTIHVTLVGQEILRGKHMSVGGVTPEDWLHFTVNVTNTGAAPLEDIAVRDPFGQGPLRQRLCLVAGRCGQRDGGSRDEAPF